MTLAKVIISIGFAIQMFICIAFALPLKINKRKLCGMIPVIIIMYLSTVYFSRSDTLWWISYIEEAFGACLLTAYCNSGNMWRNYVIMWFNFQGANVLFILEWVLINKVFGIVPYILSDKASSIEQVICEVILILIDAVIVLKISKKVFKREFDGKGHIYRILVLTQFIIGTTSGFMRLRLVREVSAEGIYSSASVISTYIFMLICVIALANILGYTYNKLEIRRLARIKSELQVVIAGNYEQYINITNSNRELLHIREDIESYRELLVAEGTERMAEYVGELDELEQKLSMIPLSGSLTIDAVISSYYKRSKELDIVFETHIDSLDSKIVSDMELAAMFDSLLKLAIRCSAKCENERWISINARHKGGSVVIKIEFSKNTDEKVEKIRIIKTLESIRNDENELRIVREIVQMHNGMLDVNDRGEEAVLSILIS